MYLNGLLALIIVFSMTFGGKYYLLETEEDKSLARKAEDITSTTPSSNKEVSIMSRSNALIKSSGKINCGQHRAASCRKCPFHGNKNYGKYWCNGDCAWKSGRCSLKKRGEVSCGSHTATTCAKCPFQGNKNYGKFWCNGDCAWKFGKCSIKACKCGIENWKSRRIVGGKEVNVKNKYPWMVALIDSAYDNHFCGGTLVASKYVISAAHCMWLDYAQTKPLKNTDFLVRIGDHDLTTEGEGTVPELSIKVKKYRNHERYNKRTFQHDITMIELAQHVDLHTYTPACLAKSSDTTTFNGKKALAYGWGRTSTRGASSFDKLLEVSVPVVRAKTCQADMSPLRITEDMICAGGLKGEDACSGDSGGPLTYKSGKQHILIGETSWGDGEGCAQDGKYGVYGRISFFRQWIEGQMNSPKYCGSGPDADR